MLAGATLHVARDPGAVADLAARFIADSCKSAIASRGVFRLALAGGHTPEQAYARLAAGDLGVDWAHVAIFFGDERRVPPDDTSSNFRMAREALFDRVPVTESAIHRILGEADAKAAVADYTRALGDAPLDLVLLGMGDDGHVASLFPGGPELESSERVVSSFAPIAPHDRISIGFPVISAARSVALLVTGAAKAPRVREIFDQRQGGSPKLPAARVTPTSGSLHWFMDDAAASEL